MKEKHVHSTVCANECKNQCVQCIVDYAAAMNQRNVNNFRFSLYLFKELRIVEHLQLPCQRTTFSFQISHFPGFSTILLQMVMAQEIQLAVRQAAVIYLKNLISHHWVKKHEDLYPVGHQPYIISDEDKQTIKENIVEATTHAAELVRYVQIRRGTFYPRTSLLMDLCCWSLGHAAVNATVRAWPFGNTVC